MKYHALPLQPMQESGASLLRAMQNESMMRLDLLTRESIQNVLDAAREGPGGEVRVSFLFRTHATETIASLLADGIDASKLRRRFPDGGRLLEIRDSLTYGLTGPLSLTDIGPGEEHGNLLKLVYEIGRTRDSEGAGGSWGLGKTCYFRMGAGLVFYYTRVQIGDDFGERLVACLVENQDSDERLQLETRTGIAWWGGEDMKPVIRGSHIRAILAQLGIRQFTGEETGTSIIIPFLRPDLIPPPDSLSGDEDTVSEAPVPWWHHSYEQYVTVAAQRWFCTRLDNPHFATGPRLSLTVNNTLVRAADMLPVFRVVQALYNRAQPSPPEGDYLSAAGIGDDAFMKNEVSIRKVFRSGGPAGTVVAALLSREQLEMSAPNNHPDPYFCLFGRTAGTAPFSPIVTFIRSPGMSICWDCSTDSRSWAGGLNGPADGRYLIALFIPTQGQRLSDEIGAALRRNDASLEYYLRSCERADHHQWADITGQTIVTRIRNNTGKHVRQFGSARVRAAAVAPSVRMSRNLADLLMPQRGAGDDGRNGRNSPVRRGSSGSGGGPRGVQAQPALVINTVEYLADSVQVKWQVRWGAEAPAGAREIVLEVSSEAGPIGAREWSEGGLGAFPFTIAELAVEPGEVGASTVTSTVLSGARVLLVPRASSLPGEIVRGTLRIMISSSSSRMLVPLLKAVISTDQQGAA